MKKIALEIFYWLVIFTADFAFYLYSSLFLLNYEDRYDVSKGPFYSLGSMTSFEKTGFILQQVWIWGNLIVLAYFLFKWGSKRYGKWVKTER